MFSIAGLESINSVNTHRGQSRAVHGAELITPHYRLQKMLLKEYFPRKLSLIYPKISKYYDSSCRRQKETF